MSLMDEADKLQAKLAVSGADTDPESKTAGARLAAIKTRLGELEGLKALETKRAALKAEGKDSSPEYKLLTEQRKALRKHRESIEKKRPPSGTSSSSSSSSTSSSSTSRPCFGRPTSADEARHS